MEWYYKEHVGIFYITFTCIKFSQARVETWDQCSNSIIENGSWLELYGLGANWCLQWTDVALTQSSTQSQRDLRWLVGAPTAAARSTRNLTTASSHWRLRSAWGGANKWLQWSLGSPVSRLRCKWHTCSQCRMAACIYTGLDRYLWCITNNPLRVYRKWVAQESRDQVIPNLCQAYKLNPNSNRANHAGLNRWLDQISL